MLKISCLKTTSIHQMNQSITRIYVMTIVVTTLMKIATYTCCEYGKSSEMWYKCRFCWEWAHAQYSRSEIEKIMFVIFVLGDTYILNCFQIRFSL